MAKGESVVYRPAEACKIAEVAPYVLRYWETEFPALSEGKDKGASRLYTARDVKIIARIRELLYDEGFTVAGAKKRLEAEIAEGRFDDGLAAAPPVAEQRKPPTPKKGAPEKPAAPAPAPPPAPAPAAAAAVRKPVPAAAAAAQASLLPRTAPAREADFDRRSVVRELREIARLLERRKK